MASQTIFNLLTIEEQARLNRQFRDAGYAFKAWDSRQEELELAYKPARTLPWMERTDFPKGDLAVYEAFMRFAATADKLDMPHYPDMRQIEKDCVATARLFIALANNSHIRDELRLLEKAVPPKKTLVQEVKEFFRISI